MITIITTIKESAAGEMEVQHAARSRVAVFTNESCHCTDAEKTTTDGVMAALVQHIKDEGKKADESPLVVRDPYNRLKN